MSVAGKTAIFKDLIYEGNIITVNASGTALTVTKGDWMAYSGAYAIAANTGIAYFKVSGVGVAMANNPVYDELGVARPNTALPVLVRGFVRVTGANSSLQDGSDLTLGMFVRPVTTGSGIVGQTGATGINAVWDTAAMVRISSNPTGALASGVGTLVAFAKAGDVTANSIDVYIHGLGQRPDYF